MTTTSNYLDKLDPRRAADVLELLTGALGCNSKDLSLVLLKSPQAFARNSKDVASVIDFLRHDLVSRAWLTVPYWKEMPSHLANLIRGLLPLHGRGLMNQLLDSWS